MTIVALIPARLHSTRLPQKLMQLIGQYTVLQHTYSNAVSSNLFTQVIAVVDDVILADSIIAIGGKAIMSQGKYDTGTDRIAAVANQIDADIIINIQADEPFLNIDALAQLIALFKNKTIQIATLKHKINSVEAQNPNVVKVLCRADDTAITFSRSVLPYNRTEQNISFYKHIGVYAFTKQALVQFAQLPQPDIEKAESLENLRLIYHNIPIHVLETNKLTIGIDTEADLEKARTYYSTIK
jgi:3-deoxy-manno-octulosonate cytidylyltransferase (CMP-KDO synthetase)